MTRYNRGVVEGKHLTRLPSTETNWKWKFLIRSEHSGKVGGHSATLFAILLIVPSAMVNVSQMGCEHISRQPSRGVTVCRPEICAGDQYHGYSAM